MTTAPRDALDRLVAALEAHFDAVTRRAGEADPAVSAAYQTLADAFETYDDALYDSYDEVTPFVLVEDNDDDLDDELDDEELDDDLDEELDEEDDLDEEDLEDDEEDLEDVDVRVDGVDRMNGGRSGQKRSG
ncbi:MAG TPA: primosomal protein [Kineosporiaceae bacterium]